MRTHPLLLPAATAGAFATLAALSPAAALDTASRLAPVLSFAAGMTVAVNLAAEANLFSWVVGKLAALPVHREVTALGFFAVCAVCTVFFSLDTTAIMLTPLAAALAPQLGIPAAALALEVVWVANLGSLFLPVSNLTNLLAVETFGSAGEYTSRALAPAAAALAVAGAASLAVRVPLRGSATPPTPPAQVPPRPTGALAVLAATLAALVSPVPYWATAAAAACAMAVAVRPRGRRLGALAEIPWRALLLAAGLCAGAGVFLQLGGSSAVLDLLAGAGAGTTAAAGATAANLANNLPAYLALEPAASDPRTALALLIGVNAGAVITPWGSLATLLWAGQLRAAGARVPWRAFVLGGLVLAPLSVAAAVAVLR